MRYVFIAFLLTLLTPGSALFALQTDTQPAATAPAASAGGPTTVLVTAVRGMVQVRTAEDAPWQPATTGMTLTEGAEFRTGPRSAVEFKIPPDQTVVLDRLGTMKVLAAINEGGKSQTDLGMKYGRTRYNIEVGGGLEHQSTIHSPSATLAVRGTDVTFADEMGFPAMAQWNARGFDKAKHSRARLTNSKTGHAQNFGGGSSDTATDADSNNAGAAALDNTNNANTHGLTAEELLLANYVPGGIPSGPGGIGGQVQDFQQLQQLAASLNNVELNHEPSFNTLFGTLEFRLTWNDYRTDLDLYTQVTLTNGTVERLTGANPPDDPIPFPVPPSLSAVPARLSTPSGGKVVKTSAGSANPQQTAFTEIIRYQKEGSFPAIREGLVGVRQALLTGPPPEASNRSTTFNVDVFINDRRVHNFDGSLTEGKNKTESFQITRLPSAPSVH